MFMLSRALKAGKGSTSVVGKGLRFHAEVVSPLRGLPQSSKRWRQCSAAYFDPQTYHHRVL